MLILVAHGSRDARWRASVEEVVASLASANGQGRVRLAYMDLTPPTLMDVATEAVGAGHTALRVLPLFLAPQGHVRRDVEPLVAEVRAALPAVQIELLPPMGQQPEFRDAIDRIARRAGAP
ncbi:MAG TPA: CbiX/SirB N-terminal domain-containing protein [Longimicrobiales bacterium]|nr:CbiX/SirB N-terminal domain-containing protein [Longimicrobiales bacterium]